MSRQSKKPTTKELEQKVSELENNLSRTLNTVDRLWSAIFGNQQNNTIGLIAAYDNVDNRSLALYRQLKQKEIVTEEDFLKTVEEIREESEEIRREMPYNKLGFFKAEDSTIEDGDLIIFSSNGTLDGQKFDGSKVENAVMVIGKQEPMEGFGAKFVGSKEGDQIDFVMNVPEGYAMEEIAGKMVRYQCEIKTVRKPMKKAENVKELPVQNNG